MTIRVLFIARYRDATMHRKIHLLRQQPDLRIWHVFPHTWQDDLLTVQQTNQHNPPDPPDPPDQPAFSLPVGMLGSPADPHRALFRTLDFALRRIHPHIIHAEEEPDSLSALQIAAARLVCAPRARLLLHSWQNVDRPKRWYVRLVLWLSLQASDGVLCANREAVALLRQMHYKGAAPVLPAVGVDTSTFLPRTAEPPLAPDGFVVGYAGRLAAEKGLDTLLAAWAALHTRLATYHPEIPLRLRLIGAGPHRATLEQQIQAAGFAGSIAFTGALPPAQVAQQLHRLHVLVLPSRTGTVWKEQFGRILVEAMASKVPVVGSSSGAIPEVIGEAGMLFPEGDATALAERLYALATRPPLRQHYAEQGYQRATRYYAQSAIAARTAAFYRQLLHHDYDAANERS